MQATREQILAANVDVAFLVQGLPLDFNVRRLERYLAMAWESGAQPVVVLTKTDLVDDVTPYLLEVETVTIGTCPTVAVSALTGEGLDDLRAWFRGNRTAVLLGSSGVGKSTIVNAFVGEELLETQEVRADDHAGRHTTTRRELILLPGGGVVSRHAGDPGTAAVGRRPRAGLRRHRRDRAEMPVRGLRARSRTGLRDPGRRWRTARSSPNAGRAISKLQRELDAVEAPTQPLAPAGASSGVQDSRTRESTQEEALTQPQRLRGWGRVRAARSGTPLWLGRRSVRRSRVRGTAPHSTGSTASGVSASHGRRRIGSSICSASTARLRPTPPNPRRAAGPFGDKSVVEWPEYAAPGWLDVRRRRRAGRTGRGALPPSRRPRPRTALLDAGTSRRRRAAHRRP